jgi:glycosyltransferase involved in cell wall biosynthesis
MDILFLNNLYPPHVVSPSDLRVEVVANALAARGHKIHVVTSKHGLGREFGDRNIDRRLRLNGVFDHPVVENFGEIKQHELHNNAVLLKAIEEFEPDVIYVWSLNGLGKSLMLQIAKSGVPYVMDVADRWITNELSNDPWLVWWNRDAVSFGHKLKRFAATMTGQRGRLQKAAPTMVYKGKRPVRGLFEPDKTAKASLNAKYAVCFPRIHFCSEALHASTSRAGFNVDHGEVIPQGIPAEIFHGEVNSADTDPTTFVMASKLTEGCGAETVMNALQLVRQQGADCTLDIVGSGDSDYISKLRNLVLTEKLPVDFKPLTNPAKQLPNVYRGYDAFIYASIYDEGWVSAPLEAMACGTPVIVSDILTCHGFYQANQNCQIFSSGDAEQIAEQMLHYHQNAEWRAGIATTAQADVLANFDINRMVTTIDTFLQQTIDYWKDYEEATVAMQ